MHVEVSGAHSGPDRGVLLTAHQRTAERRAGRADRPAGEGARRPGAPAAAVARRLPRRRRGLRVRPQRRLRPVAAHDQPPPQGAARRGPPGPGEAGRVGVLPHQRRRAARLRCPARRRGPMTGRMSRRISDSRRMPLVRRAVAELIGTAFLVAAVIGSGIAATRLSPDDVGLQLLENSLVTGAALVALILALQPVSASFNPVVTLVERALGLVSTRAVLALVPAQVVGACLGAIVANLMFDLDAVSVATQVRTGPGL